MAPTKKKNAQRPNLSSNSTATESMINLTKPTLQGLYDEDVNKVDEDDLTRYARKQLDEESKKYKRDIEGNDFGGFSLFSTKFFQENSLGKYIIFPLIKLIAIPVISCVVSELLMKMNPTDYKLETYKLPIVLGAVIYVTLPMFDKLLLKYPNKQYESITTLTKTWNAVLGVYLGVQKYHVLLKDNMSDEYIMALAALAQIIIWIMFDFTKSILSFSIVSSMTMIYLLGVQSPLIALYMFNISLASSLIIGKATRYLRFF
ncbi:uncharacterized protein HGUI_02365 [Hanseniaspora guilliermondii]|uniref:Uncharacterized protein n=1 Tax=Hanseniaspora guilliermondii TaxID=56406 RepID=A0A1L0CMU2_9ASCO|nr:uncharacterized protein HGUI_02365 [Hanseniaspora guilliermondii]